MRFNIHVLHFNTILMLRKKIWSCVLVPGPGRKSEVQRFCHGFYSILTMAFPFTVKADIPLPSLLQRLWKILPGTIVVIRLQY